MFEVFNDPVSSITHLLGAIATLFLFYVLFSKGRGNAWRLFSLGLFCFGFLFLFSMSGVYHMLAEGDARDVLRRIDHAAIWVMIAGSFTPLHIILCRGFWRWGFTILIWVLAITGLVLKTVFFHQISYATTLLLFLALGWMGFISFIHLYKIVGLLGIRNLIYGGLAYTAGALCELFDIPHLFSGLIGPHEVFHVFVLLGAYFHALSVFNIADHPVHDEVVFHVYERDDGYFHAEWISDYSKVTAINKVELLEKIHQSVARKYSSSFHKPHLRLRFLREEHHQYKLT